MRSFVGCDGHPKHDLPASRVSDSVEGCGKVEALRPVGCFRLEGHECLLDGGEVEFTVQGVGG